MAKPNGTQSVCIMGCGRVGAMLAEHFHSLHYAVHVIDVNSDAFRRLNAKELHGTHTTQGDGTDPDVLERADIKHTDIFIAVTEGDNRNVLAAQIAKHQFNVPQVICRIYDPKRHEIYRDKLGIRSICPTIIGAEAIFDTLTKTPPALAGDPPMGNGNREERAES
ncbi:MAG: potassium channel family protein [Candidatus Saccharimonadales bacterium]